MEVSSFAEIEEEFMRRVQRTVWCTVATVDSKGRPRTRILHPVWEGTTGWIATDPNSLKAKHLAGNPYVSLSYWDPNHEQVYVDARAEWVKDPKEGERIWNLLKSLPQPYGYDPGMIWQEGLSDPRWGVLKITPWRIEMFSLQTMISGEDAIVWRA
ncbi:MAG TPA: pyridoxamine 5'-phosphate oxidase family protein [Dehalococcoidia bacterium]|nr:pyridoxamine 5'-phosphate oxidase family protein [Dehalococcoidia bacterium]